MSAFEAQALWLSLQVALATVLVASPLAVVLATLMARTRWRGKLLVDSLILLPMGLPPVAIGLSLVSGLGRHEGWVHELTGWSLSFFPLGAMAAAGLMTLPLMVRVLRPAFEATDPMLLPVARTLGASRWQAWWTLTLPLAWPAVASAMALGLAAAWGEASATLLLAAAISPQDLGHGNTPSVLFEALQRHDGSGASWPLVLLALGVALTAVALSELGRQRWRQRWQSRLRPVGVGMPAP